MPYLPTLHSRIARNAQRNTATSGGAWVGALDAGSLQRLRELDPGDRAGLVARVVATYVASLERLLAQWAAARAAADLSSLRHVAHTLKSSSASVGALKLATVCADVERRIRDGEIDGIEPELDALAREARHVLGQLRESEAAA
jgi:HPt (histidine-containing phosphotransfer) domain-containing protein